MKRIYLLIVAAGNVSLKSCFLHVSVGSSTTDLQGYRFLQQFAEENNFFFALRDLRVIQFVSRIATSLSVRVFDLKHMHIDCDQLVRYIKMHKTTPVMPPLTRSAAFFRQIINPAAYFQRQIDVIRNAEARRRKKPKATSSCKNGLKSPKNISPTV